MKKNFSNNEAANNNNNSNNGGFIMVNGTMDMMSFADVVKMAIHRIIKDTLNCNILFQIITI